MEKEQPVNEIIPAVSPEVNVPLADGFENHTPGKTAESQPTEVQEAIASIHERDTVDVYARRLNGTSVLGTKSIAGIAAPSSLLVLMMHSVYNGGPITAATAATAGTAIAGAAYGLQRATEKKRAEKAETAQQVVRDALNEPVDLIRCNQDKDELILRWFGADEQYGGHNNPSIPTRFEKIVKFAEDNDVNKIVTSANIATVDGEVKDIATTNTRALLKDVKQQPIDDLKSDKKLVELTPMQAREILDRLKSENQVTKTEAIADWLVTLKSNHPLRPILDEWKRLEKPETLLPKIQNVVRTGLERHFSSDRLPETMMAGVHRIRTESTARVEPGGVHFTDTPTKLVADQPQTASAHYMPFSRLVNGGDMNSFVDDLLEQRDKPTKIVDAWQLELAMYHLLTTGNQSQATTQTKQPAEGSEFETETLFQRMLKEPPRTSAIKPGLSKRGAVEKSDQTIEYKRHSNWFKKSGAAAVAFCLGSGLGIGWSEAWEKSETECDPTYTNIRTATPEQESCNSPVDKFYGILDNAADAITSGSATWEDKIITKAYELGIITPENYQKFLDISFSIPEQPQETSGVGDVDNGSEDSILWSLEPLNGANTEGYWYTNIQNNISLQSDDQSVGIAPYNGLSMTYRNTEYRDSFFTSGEMPSVFDLISIESDVQQMRDLNIPNAPDSSDSELIKVSGEMPLSTTSLTEMIEPGVTKGWNSLVLPVISGGDIVAAEVTLIDTATGEIIEGVDSKIIQKNDGTFNVLTDGTTSGIQMKIDYWVDPNATTDTLLYATEPMSVSALDQYHQNLSELLSEEDVSGILDSLGLPADATASQVAEAIQASDTYSFTPYGDAKVTGTINLENDTEIQADELLTNIATEAVNLDSSNCNVAFTIGLIASRGIDDYGYINGAIGYWEDGNGVLSETELHQWAITNTGEIIDGTPIGDSVEKPPIAELESASNRKNLLLATQLAGGLLAMAVSAVASRRYWPKAEEIILDHQTKTAAKWLDEPKHAAGLNQATAALRHMMFARPGSKLPEILPTTNPQPITRQLANLPQLNRKQVRTTLKTNQPVDRNIQRNIRKVTAKHRITGRTTNRRN